MENKLKINFHITEACNFSCKFCFARYCKRQLSFEQQKTVIKSIAKSGLFDSINFAGGEPLLIPELPELIKYSHDLGLKVSIITNGFLLNKEYLDKILPFVSMIGISVHSFDDNTKKLIGSCTKGNEVLTNEQLKFICEYVNFKNSRKESDCSLKINTVVCSLNNKEEMCKKIEYLDISKWKILRCQEFGTNKDFCINDYDYKAFCIYNRSYKLKQIIENTMKNTYIMLNPAGELIKESKDGLSYDAIGSVLENDISILLSQYSLNYELYSKRYA